MTMQADKARQALHEAWDEMILALQSARDAIDKPELMPAPISDRNLAEGYRYLMGFVHAGVERAFHNDPQRPQFRNTLSVITRGTIDNADAIYFYAPIDGRESYRIHGEMGDSRQWRGDKAAAAGVRKAPHYLIFETTSGGMAGDSGDLAELRPGMKTQPGRLDSSEIEVNADGSFDILLAPRKPASYAGNFISTMKVVNKPHPADPSAGPERYASYVSGRQLFNDWEHEEAIHLEITQLDAEGSHSPPTLPSSLQRTFAGSARSSATRCTSGMHSGAFPWVLMANVRERFLGWLSGAMNLIR